MYKARVTKDRSSAIIFMVDQSGSMGEMINFEGQTLSKAEVVTMLLNSAISELIYRCKGKYEVNHYFDIGVIGYSGQGVYSLLNPKKDLLSIVEISNMDKPKKRANKTITLNGKQRLFTNIITQWTEAKSIGTTPQLSALEKVIAITLKWSKTHPKSFPMMVFNITDGDFSGCNPSDIISKANELKNIATNDGKTLFFNIHISNKENTEHNAFPSSSSEANCIAHGKLLYEISSTLPRMYKPIIRGLTGVASATNHKALILNGSFNDLFYILNIGSSTLSILP